MRLGAEKIATGHYARVRRNEATGRHELLKGLDPAKDQSYFLHRLNQQQLSKTLFPVGELRKTEVRRIADEIGLPNAKKKDSTGICFIGERPFREFLERYLPRAPGPIESPDGERLGTHRGLAFYTLGQRGGIGLGGRAGGPEEPWYVAAKDAARNALVVVQGGEHPLLSSTALTTGRWHWLGSPPEAPMRCTVKVRYRQADQPVLLTPRSDGTVHLEFAEPQRAVTPGQYAVAYDGDRCMGGGVIEVVAPPLQRSAAA